MLKSRAPTVFGGGPAKCPECEVRLATPGSAHDEATMMSSARRISTDLSALSGAQGASRRPPAPTPRERVQQIIL